MSVQIRSSLRLICFLLLVTGGALAQSSYFFQNKEIKPGSKCHFTIPISTGEDSTFIPVTIFNGAKDGKTLGITAGVHGYEYAPILAAQKLIHSIDPQKLSGVVVLVQLASVESFLGRSAYKSPVDGKNLNRTFPGARTGTNTEKVAAFITEHIIARSNYFLDIHSGDAPEDLISYGAYYSNSDLPAISAKGKEMAISLGFNHVVKFDTDGKGYIAKGAPSLYCTAEAFKRGIPSIDIECGRLGMVEQSAVDRVQTSVFNLLADLNFVIFPYKPVGAKPPVMISNRDYTASKFDGIFYPAKKAGDLVRKGMKLGHVTDFFGKTLQTVYAESDGLLMLIISTPPINKGEDLVVIGKLN